MQSKWISLIGLLIASSTQAEVLKIGLQGTFPPYDFMKEGKLTGFNVDIANRLCEVMKVECKFVPTKWDALIPSVENKTIDAAIASITITQARKQKVLFSTSYTKVSGSFIGKKGKFLTAYVTNFDLKNKRLGVQANTIYSAYVAAKYANDPQIHISEFPSAADMYAALKNSEIDIALDDIVSAYEGHLKEKEWQGYELVGSPVRDSKYMGDGEGIAVNLNNPALKKRFDVALSQIIKDGSYQRIMYNYFIFNVYGK
ncbi:transporter substrate-binding domain-containing protein [Leeia sp. TBRC 13508]|uniref:Transporter substrate-binding domain-containing protein n=1 Tax=Leeia speluncae TaxID=2884804 RepID=A0ABS8D9X0_9NEIS|nr:transporter substrate-binding domain-containing protein [Leeia speluncae]MCB6185010.1 transporter substrate-binding domain-containing protein [Leeia speluncae]